jgi:hypothetical protein
MRRVIPPSPAVPTLIPPGETVVVFVVIFA